MPNNATEFRASFVFEKLNLVQGGYIATVYVGCDGQNHEILDAALELEIIEADVFGTGRLPYVHTGPMLVTPALSLVSTQH